MSAPWKKKSTLIAKVLEKIPNWVKLFARSNTKSHRQSGNLLHETLDLHSKRNFEKDEETWKKIPVPVLRHGHCRTHNVQCLWCKAHKFVDRRRGASSKFVPRRICFIQALTQLEIRPQSERYRPRTKQSAAVRQGQEPSPKRPTQNVSNLETPNRERSTVQLRKDGTWTQSIAEVSDARKFERKRRTVSFLAKET